MDAHSNPLFVQSFTLRTSGASDAQISNRFAEHSLDCTYAKLGLSASLRDPDRIRDYCHSFIHGLSAQVPWSHHPVECSRPPRFGARLSKSSFWYPKVSRRQFYGSSARSVTVQSYWQSQHTFCLEVTAKAVSEDISAEKQAQSSCKDKGAADAGPSVLRLFNTLTRDKDVFTPIDPHGKRVLFYSCGPTVYNYAHIGNFRAFLTYDVLKRYLRYRGYSVFHVVNITDVDDKIIRKVQEENSSLDAVTKRYSDAFFEDMATLNIVPADIYPKATEHIDEMLAMVRKLLRRKHAYVKDGSVYFSVSTFPSYGRLAHLDFGGMQLGTSVSDADEYDKENARDFVLWKGYKEQDGDVVWEDTEFGRGRPGWHLECSCMSMKYLGDTMDIHAGGVDLVFPHHENEIAQSECVSGKPFANYWIHNGFVNINDEKMSKSLGNFITVRDMVKSADDARAFRYLVVSSQYRMTLNFSSELLTAAKNTLKRISNFLDRLHKAADAPASDAGEEAIGGDPVPDLIAGCRANFRRHMDDDLNTPRAVAAIFDFMGAVDAALKASSVHPSASRAARNFILDEVDSVLGIFYDVPLPPGAEAAAADDGVDVSYFEQLIAERAEARKTKNWARADEIRQIFQSKGFALKDQPSGTTWEKL